MITRKPVFSDLRPGSEVKNFFHAHESTEYEILTAHQIEMLKNKDFSCFKTLICCTNPTNICKNVNNCWHFNINEQDKFHSQLS